MLTDYTKNPQLLENEATIEALRAELQQVKGERDALFVDDLWGQKYAEAMAELQQVQDALRRISTQRRADGVRYAPATVLRNIARAALEGTDQ